MLLVSSLFEFNPHTHTHTHTHTYWVTRFKQNVHIQTETNCLRYKHSPNGDIGNVRFNKSLVFFLGCLPSNHTKTRMFDENLIQCKHCVLLCIETKIKLNKIKKSKIRQMKTYHTVQHFHLQHWDNRQRHYIGCFDSNMM